MKKVSVIIPMYYEEEVAEECYKRLKENIDFAIKDMQRKNVILRLRRKWLKL